MKPVENPPLFISACNNSRTRVNRSFTEMFGITSEEFGSQPLTTKVHPEDHHKFKKAIETADATLSARLRVQANEYELFDLEIKAQGGEVVVLGHLAGSVSFRGHARSVTPTVNVNTLQHTLETMARVVEENNPGMRCSILLIDWETECVFMGVGPSLPAEYNEAVNGLHIGPMVGSCGTASYWNLPVIVENIAEDPLWIDLRDVAKKAGVQSCWSHPVTTTTGEVLGAMALYNDKPCSPKKHHMDGLEIASRMVGLAIEREKLESQLRHSSKMEAIGLLAGGIAHDFNNILVAILGNAEIAIDNLTPDSEVSDSLNNIVKASLNASELCAQLLGFAGKQGSASENLDCNRLVKEIGDLAQVTMSKKIDVSYQLSNEPVEIQGDKSQLGQVILNLLTNAAESIGSSEGRIDLETKIKFYGQTELQAIDAQTQLNSGFYICLSITDTGCGMSEKMKSKIYDPFFTTKPEGRGLGLAAVRGIAQGHSGLLTLSSVENEGTIFSMILPQAILQKTPEIAVKPTTSTKKGTVLIVDDDEMVRDVLKMSLVKAGHKVLTASDGQEGIDIFSENFKTIDCILLDLNMPKLDGEEVYREMCKIHADVKVILCSGYAAQDIIDRFKGAKLAGVLKKPMKMQLLLEKVAEVLE